VEKVRNRASAKIRAKAYRSPQVHRFDSATIVNSKESVSIADDMDRSRVGNKESSRVGSEAAATEERRRTVTHLGCQSAAAKDDVRGQPGTEYGTVAEIPGEIHVIQKAQNGWLSKAAISIDIERIRAVAELEVIEVPEAAFQFEAVSEEDAALQAVYALGDDLVVIQGVDPGWPDAARVHIEFSTQATTG